MNLYLISQNQNSGWDTFDSAVVAAIDEESARLIHPDKNREWDGKDWGFFTIDGKFYNDGVMTTWAKTEHIKVEYIGIAKNGTEAGVICASFNAG